MTPPAPDKADGTSIGERLATMDGKLTLILFQLSAFEPRIKDLEKFQRETEKTMASNAGVSAQIRIWLPILIAAFALIWSVVK